MRIYLLIFVSVLIGRLWGVASCYLRRQQRAETENALASHVAFRQKMNEMCPDHRGAQ